MYPHNRHAVGDADIEPIHILRHTFALLEVHSGLEHRMHTQADGARATGPARATGREDLAARRRLVQVLHRLLHAAVTTLARDPRRILTELAWGQPTLR